MKQNMLKTFYVATVIVAFGVVACNLECDCGPSDATCLQNSSSSETLEPSSSGDVLVLSSSSEVVDIPSSSSSALEGVSSSVVAESSSSVFKESSSSVLSSSSIGFLDKCIDFARLYPACDGYYRCKEYNRSPVECTGFEGAKVEDCRTGGIYTCLKQFGTAYWTLDKGQCLNVALTKCAAGDTLCGRQPCNYNAPMIVTDCGSGDEYACVDSYWTLMKPSENCTHITDASDEKCNVEKGTKTVDCVQRKEFVCDGTSWRKLEPVVGENCLVESEFYVEKKWLPSSDKTKPYSGSYDITYLCSEGKWIEYMGTFMDLDACRMHPIHRTPCDENDSANKKIINGECEFECRNGEYIFVPPPVEMLLD